MTIQEQYNTYKSTAKTAYLDMYDQVYEAIIQDTDKDEDNIEADNLTVDIILSNILGYVISFDEVHDLIAKSITDKGGIDHRDMPL